MISKLVDMKFFVRIIVFLVLLSNLGSCKNATPNISVVTPQPVKIIRAEGSFIIPDTIGIYTNIPSPSAPQLSQWLTMMPLGNYCKQDQAQLHLMLDSADSTLSNQAYRLAIDPSGITIEASAQAGLFYGVQSLAQLYYEYGNELPYVSIEDAPRFSHRAFMLDCSSRMLSVEFIKKQLEMMAHYKLNYLYWNIVDNEYSSQQMREVVEYAAQCYINVIPAIEVPWQSEALALLEKVLPEIIATFPSDLIYIGDTATDNNTIPRCQTCRKPIKDSRLDSKEAQAIARIEKLLQSAGRQMATSQDGLQYGLSTGSVIVHSGDLQDIKAIISLGYRVVAASTDFSAFDCYQSSPLSEPEAMPGMLPIEKVYNFNPPPANMESLTGEGTGTLLGICVNMRTGLTPDDSAVEYMIYPRLLAAAEVAWSQPERKSSMDFKKRAQKAVKFLADRGYNAFDPATENILRSESMETVSNLAAGKNVYYHILHDQQYAGAGTLALVDGERGGWAYDDGRWQGFQGSGINLTIDLGSETAVKSITATFMHDHIARILPPREIDISYSHDGKTFTLLKHFDNGDYSDKKGFSLVDFVWQGDIAARYISYVAKPHGGLREWTFTDEIVVK